MNLPSDMGTQALRESRRVSSRTGSRPARQHKNAYANQQKWPKQTPHVPGEIAEVVRQENRPNACNNDCPENALQTARIENAADSYTDQDDRPVMEKISCIEDPKISQKEQNSKQQYDNAEDHMAVRIARTGIYSTMRASSLSPGRAAIISRPSLLFLIVKII
jgi:hypothetical protein